MQTIKMASTSDQNFTMKPSFEHFGIISVETSFAMENYFLFF